MSDASATPSATSEALRTPLHAAHLRLGARMMPFAGFDMPVQYSSIREEHEAVRERAGLFDVSHMGQVHLSGPRANEAAEALVTCEIASLRVDRARYGLMLNDEAGCVDDVMVTREADDALFFCVNASNIERDVAWIQDRVGPDVLVEDRSAETALLALQGPAASAILKKLASPGAELPKRFRVSRLSISGIDVLVSATGYTGAPGFEIYLPGTYAEKLFDQLLEIGADDGILPAGLGARDTLRLEAGLALYGHELDDTTSPFEAGLDRFVKPLESGFIGSEVLGKRSQGADDRLLVGFEMIGRGIARADYEILSEGQVVGRVTSGAPSPTLGKSIGLGYVPRRLAEAGQPLQIRIRTKDIDAQIVKVPFLK
ncbi:MAG: glycine cleavage system aminomethyltransferase GcvT [Myxococcota bacterium]